MRYFADKVRPLTGRNIIVENRSGAGGNIAIIAVRGARQARRLHGRRCTARTALPPAPKNQGRSTSARLSRAVATINPQPFMILVDAKSPYQTLADLTAAREGEG